MVFNMPPCPSCQASIETPDPEINTIIRIPVCSDCMTNFHSDDPNQKKLDLTVDYLADELHDYINKIWPSG